MHVAKAVMAGWLIRIRSQPMLMARASRFLIDIYRPRWTKQPEVPFQGAAKAKARNELAKHGNLHHLRFLNSKQPTHLNLFLPAMWLSCSAHLACRPPITRRCPAHGPFASALRCRREHSLRRSRIPAGELPAIVWASLHGGACDLCTLFMHAALLETMWAAAGLTCNANPTPGSETCALQRSSWDSWLVEREMKRRS